MQSVNIPAVVDGPSQSCADAGSCGFSESKDLGETYAVAFGQDDLTSGDYNENEFNTLLLVVTPRSDLS